MKDNVFENHGIASVSPSSINLFVDNTPKWAAKYLLGMPQGQKPVFWRGDVIDKSCGRFFGMLEDQEQMNKEDCIAIAGEQYLGLAKAYEEDGLEVDPDEVTKQAKHLDTFIELAIDHYASLGTPTEYQKPIETMVDECPVPLTGFLDFIYDGDVRVVRDLKTTAKTPDMRRSVRRQLAVYAQAEQAYPIVDYVYVNSKNRQVVSMEVTDWEAQMMDVRRILLSMKSLLSVSSDAEEIVGLLYPDFEKWCWDADEIAYAKNIWSIK